MVIAWGSDRRASESAPSVRLVSYLVGTRCLDVLTPQLRRDIQTLHHCRNIQSLLQCRIMPTKNNATPARGPFRIYTPSSLGDAIRHYRTEAGMTQADLADKAGLQRSYLSELESGKETEQVKRLFRVLRELGVRMTLDKADW